MGSSDGLQKTPIVEDDLGAFERLLFTHSRDGMLLVRVERGASDQTCFRIQAANPAAAAHLEGFGPSQNFVGHDIEKAFPAWLGKQILSHYRACVSTREVRRYEIVQPNGAIAHESIATPVMGTDGTTVEYVAVVMRGVGERILQEKKLNIALAKAEEANRSKSEFFASMSHELRTPLNAIIGFSDVMESGIGGTLSSRHRQYIEYIRNSGQHLLSVISDILDLSKMEAGHFKLQEIPVAIAPLAETCVQMVRERAMRKQIELLMSVPPDVPDLLADPVRIKQILLNLLSNAIKFTEQGSVTLAATFDVAVGFSFSVTDTGVGMTPEELKIALQPFCQVEDAYTRNHEGTGLGLPITKHLTELHGGSLELTSQKSAGTCAVITLAPSRAIQPKRQDRIAG